MDIREFKYLSFSYLECTLEKLLPSIFKIWNNRTHSISTNQVLHELYKIEQFSGGGHFENIIFYQINSSGCIMISNYADGMESMTHIISAQLNIEILNFRISSNDCRCPVNSLSSILSGKMQRMVYALKENKWIFYSFGEPLWFEIPKYYENKLIKNRINEAIIFNYCIKLGLDIMNPFFWNTNDAVVVKRMKW